VVLTIADVDVEYTYRVAVDQCQAVDSHA